MHDAMQQVQSMFTSYTYQRYKQLQTLYTVLLVLLVMDAVCYTFLLRPYGQRVQMYCKKVGVVYMLQLKVWSAHMAAWQYFMGFMVQVLTRLIS